MLVPGYVHDPRRKHFNTKSKKNFITIREAGYDDLDDFRKIMSHTAERRNFENRPLLYYQEMYHFIHEIIKRKIEQRELFQPRVTAVIRTVFFTASFPPLLR